MKKFFLFSALLLGCLPSTGFAWEQTMTCTPVYLCETSFPVAWKDPCVSFYLNEKGTRQIPLNKVLITVQKSLLNWQRPQLSSLIPHFSGLTDDDKVGHDVNLVSNANIIVFRDDDWLDSRSILALTWVTFLDSNGDIYDADIEVNSYTYQFGIVEEDGNSVMDLENTLTHELGHAFGLEHSSVEGSTMSTHAPKGDTSLRTLDTDDLLAIAALYPVDAHKTCHFKDDYYSPEIKKAASNEDACSAQPSRKQGNPGWLLGLMGLLAGYFVTRKRNAARIGDSQ